MLRSQKKSSMYSLGKETYSVGAALSSEDVQVVVKPEPQKLLRPRFLDSDLDPIRQWFEKHNALEKSLTLPLEPK